MNSVSSSDRRVFGRRRADITAQVRIGYRFVSCVIVDISEGGALLEFSEPVDLPSRIWLTLPDQKGEVVCDVRHHRKNAAGVQFLRPQPLSLRLAALPTAPQPVVAAAKPESAQQPVSAAAQLVAERRRAVRNQLNVPVTVRMKPPEPEPPRDLSTIIRSLTGTAAVVTIQVPLPLAAACYRGAPVQPPACTAPHAAVRPLASHKFCRDIALHTVMRTQTHAHYVALADIVLTQDGHPAAMAAWRRLSCLPPRPLPAWIFAFDPEPIEVA